MLRFDRTGAAGFCTEVDKAKCAAAIETLTKGTGEGNDFIGWVDLPANYDKEEFARIQAAAKKICADSKALVVIGIGGGKTLDTTKGVAHYAGLPMVIVPTIASSDAPCSACSVACLPRTTLSAADTVTSTFGQ